MIDAHFIFETKDRINFHESIDRSVGAVLKHVTIGAGGLGIDSWSVKSNSVATARHRYDISCVAHELSDVDEPRHLLHALA